MAKFTLKPNAELDLLTKEELRTELQEVLSGYLRPPQLIRNPSGIDLDSNGDGTVDAYQVEAGMRLTITRIEFTADGYRFAEPYVAATGGIDIYVDGQWRDGVPFGTAAAVATIALPWVYTESQSRAIVCADGAHVTIVVDGGPASTGLTVNLCGILEPLQPVI